MKVLWSTLSLVVVGALAVFLWIAAASPSDSQILLDGVVVEGGPASSSPRPSGTVSTPSGDDDGEDEQSASPDSE